MNPASRHRKRYGWFRQYNDFPTHPKWDLVATMTCVEKCRVLAIVECLMVAANKGRPRGSIGEFSVLECAASLRISPHDVHRVYRALEEVGWIDREYLVTWDERQPDREDPTALDRQARRRAKIREQNQSASRRDMRDVTPRLDKISKKEATEEEAGLRDWQEAEKWKAAHQRALPLGPVGLVRRSGS